MREWKEGKQMSDSLTHPSALAMSRTKPARQSRMMEKQKLMGRNRYNGGKEVFFVIFNSRILDHHINFNMRQR